MPLDYCSSLDYCIFKFIFYHNVFDVHIVTTNSKFYNITLKGTQKEISTYILSRVAEVARGQGGPPPKSLEQERKEIVGQKKCLFGSKAVVFGQEVHYYLVYIAYFTELILQICDYAQKRRI